MSAARGDCEHGHGKAILELAKAIGEAHGVEGVFEAVLVVGGEKASKVFGHFNTASLGNAAMAVLEECANHTPDGCNVCDPSARAAKLAAEVFISEFRRQQRAHAHNAGEQL